MNSHHTMKELPESEMPYEKFLRNGVQSLSDADLLAVILRNGSKERTALQLAQDILCKGEKNLLNLNRLSLDELQEIPGIGRVKAIQLKCVAELSRRMASTKYQRAMQANNPGTVADYYMERLRHETKEKLLLAMFDVKNHFLGDAVISIGTVNSSLVSPREIYLEALRCQAFKIILLHNHPSGDPEPSEEDRRTTMRISECGKLLGIHLVDHIIIGDNRYISFRETGILSGE